MAERHVITSTGGTPGGQGGWLDAEVGRKAVGLAGLPAPWCPPFLVVTTAAYARWSNTKVDAQWLFQEAGLRAEIDRVCGAEAQVGQLLIRSSAPDEGLQDRGRYESASCKNQDDDIVRTVTRLWAEVLQPATGLALIVQPLIACALSGHLSNERRLSRDAREWVCEYEEVGGNSPAHRRILASEEIVAAGDTLPCPDRPTLWRQLSVVAGIGSRAWGRIHYEWVWDGQRLWIVQQDVEEPREGPPPGSFEVRSAQQAINDFEVLVRSDRSQGPWHKTDCVRVFIECGLRTKPVYAVEGEGVIGGLIAGRPDPKLVAEIKRLGASPIVGRTAVDKNAGYPETLLPRTDCVDAERALTFLTASARKLAVAGLKASQFCFLLHNYVTAKAASLSRAVPGSQTVTIDATWGNADGLLYYPHDTFEVHLGRRPRVRAYIRCKDRFIDCNVEGRWAERPAGIPWDWEPSLTKGDTIEIAKATKVVAERLGHAVEVMHFVGVDAGEPYPVCLPWYYGSESKDVADPGSGLQRVSIFSKDVITIRTPDDLRRETERAAAKKPSRGCTLRLVPSQELLRDQAFLAQVADFALLHHLPVRLEGSVLSHVYYVLERRGVMLKVPLPLRRGPRRRRFNKLVRDKIPEIIRGHGEAANAARVRLSNHPDLIKAKLVEEAFELFWEHEPKGVRREMADLLEVMRAICGVLGIGFEEVVAEADRKREERGGFDDGVILLDTNLSPAPPRHVQRTLFDDPRDGAADDELAKVPPAETPRGTKTGISIPLVPPRSDHSEQGYAVRSLDGGLDAVVVYSGRKVFVRPNPAGQAQRPGQPSLFGDDRSDSSGG